MFIRSGSLPEPGDCDNFLERLEPHLPKRVLLNYQFLTCRWTTFCIEMAFTFRNFSIVEFCDKTSGLNEYENVDGNQEFMLGNLLKKKLL